MRLAILALSAAAISGCSWLGGGHYTAHQTIECYPGGVGYGYQGYTGHMSQGHYGYGQGSDCVGGIYGVQSAGGVSGYEYGLANSGYGVSGYGSGPAAGYASSGFGGTGFTGTSYTAGGFSSGATTLNAAAPYGAAVSGQFGQVPGMQTVAGAPIYMAQPYGVPQPVTGPGCCGGGYGFAGGAMPFGVELFVGTEFGLSGDAFTKKPIGPPDGDFSQNVRVGGIDPIGYNDAFGDTKTVGLAATYDLSPNTTLIGAISKGTAEGQTVREYTTVQPGTWSGTTFTPTTGSTARSLDGTFSDLETTTLEAGLRHYVGYPRGLRPYVGATAGIQHNDAVTFTQTHSDDGSAYGEREFFGEGWTPTASATLGAELALGHRAAIGVESGIRWRDSMNSASESEGRLTVPLTLRGRLSF